MIGAGLFTESMGFDIGVIVALLTGLSIVIALLVQIKQGRKEEIRAVLNEVINASPEKIVVSPSPLLVRMEETFVTKSAFDELKERVKDLEDHRESDKKELLDKMDGIPGKVIALLKDTKGLI